MISVEPVHLIFGVSVSPRYAAFFFSVQQIRNLEVRLAILTGSDSHHGETYTQRQGREHKGHGDCAKTKHYCVHRQEPLPVVEEEPLTLWEENSDRLLYSTASAAADHRVSAREHRLSTSSASLASENRPASATCAADVASSGVATPAAWEIRLRKFESQFRQRCVVFGARVANASGVAVETAKEAAQLAAAGRVDGGSVRRGGRAVKWAEEVIEGSITPPKASEYDNQTKRDGVIEEYWGSDHCTSA